jgi:hypothetical protein
MSNNNYTEIESGKMQLYDYYNSALKSGEYNINVSQKISINNGQSTNDIEQINADPKTIVITGPRFSVENSDIHTKFPAANSSGRFAECLPHIVFNKRILPWERGLKKNGGNNEISDNTPWMALLLFEEDELIGEKDGLIGGDPNSPTKTKTWTVDDMLTDDSKILKPNIDNKDITESEGSLQCQTIHITDKTFKDIVPFPNEMEYLSHVRQVYTGDKPILGIKDDGMFSVVIGNRFPKTGNKEDEDKEGVKNIVHLVSLEGFEEYLKENSELPKKYVCLVSLARWSFWCLPERGETFTHLVMNLAPENVDPEKLLLRLPIDEKQNDDPGTIIATSRLKEGYVPLCFHTHSGADTFAWYRGPLTPVNCPLIEKSKPFSSSTAAIIYDENEGLFDHSLAAAWQIGRALALADKIFGAKLLKFRRAGHYLVDQLLERYHSPHLDTPKDLKKLPGDNLIKDKFVQMLKDDLCSKVQKISTGDNDSTTSVTDGAKKKDKDVQTSIQKAIKDFMVLDDVQDMMKNKLIKDILPIAEWLAHLKMLYNVPFNHLVADERMLPAESLRFFYLDENWLDAAKDGALSIGVETSRDVLFMNIMKGMISDKIDKVTKTIRLKLRGQSIDQETGSNEAGSDEKTSGLLIRSALIAGWPGLSIQAFKNGNQLKIRRMDRLSPNVLFCIFSGIPDIVKISEPHEALSFGVDENGEIQLRNIDDSIGKPIENNGKIKIYDPNEKQFCYMRNANDRVLNINTLYKELLTNKLLTKLGKQKLYTSQFALQMIRTPKQLSLKL